MSKSNVVLGFLGTQLDAGVSEKRWERWRPTVGLVGQPDLPVARIELFLCKPDDEVLARRVKADIEAVSPQTQVVTHNLRVEDPWNFPAMYAALHDFATRYTFVDGEDYFIHLSTGTHVAQICLFLLTEAHYFPGKLLGSRKADAAIAWHGRAEIVDLDLSSYDQLASRFRKEQVDSQTLLKGGIVTRNAAFNELITRIEKVSLRSTAPMLLTGPTGAGKSQLAERIFELRTRRNLVQGEFVEVNCATLRGENAMSALFGHKKGAYTGATADRPGLLKTADKGILFLDEIGELALDEQAMLLRALEHRRFLPMGSDKEVQSDFQLLAGTNKDLNAEVAKGTFRADLLARINLWSFTLPGLADRPEDIEPNLDYELECASQELGKISMNSEAREAYLAFAMKAPWPGNFRDFRASVSRMATLCSGGRIRIEDVRLETQTLAHQMRFATSSTSSQGNYTEHVLGAKATLYDKFELAQFEAVMAALANSKSLAEAGRTLFAVSRKEKANPNDSDRVKKFLARYGLEFADVKQVLARL